MPLFNALSDLHIAVKDEVERQNNGKFDMAFGRMVAGAEQRMFHGSGDPLRCDPLRLRVMETSQALTLSSGEVALPSNYLQVIRLDCVAEPRAVPVFEEPASFFVNRYANNGGAPIRYTIDGAMLVVSPAVSWTIRIKYYARPTALVDGNNTNLVLTTFPMLYFHATLIEAFSYLRNASEMQKQFSAYVSMASGLNRSESHARLGWNAPMAPRIPGPR